MPQLDLLPKVVARRSRDRGRSYFVNAAGQRFPSVTTILNVTKPQADREALARWRNRVGVAEASRISQTASRRGTQTHKRIHQYFLGELGVLDLEGDASCPEAIAPYWQSLASVLPNIDQVRLLEGTVFHDDLGYAGRVDCIASYQGIPCVVDWKTADQPKESVERLYDGPLQLAAYAGAVNQTYGEQGLQIRHALIVVAIADQPAEVFWFEPETLQPYWQTWMDRVSRFHRYFGT